MNTRNMHKYLIFTQIPQGWCAILKKKKIKMKSNGTERKPVFQLRHWTVTDAWFPLLSKMHKYFVWKACIEYAERGCIVLLVFEYDHSVWVKYFHGINPLLSATFLHLPVIPGHLLLSQRRVWLLSYGDMVIWWMCYFARFSRIYDLYASELCTKFRVERKRDAYNDCNDWNVFQAVSSYIFPYTFFYFVFHHITGHQFYEMLCHRLHCMWGQRSRLHQTDRLPESKWFCGVSERMLRINSNSKTVFIA